MSEAPILVHYDPKLPVRLAGDASNYGIGAVLSHVDPEGQEHPIAFTSRTLTNSEKNYSQIEKEALSLIHGIRKFRNYIYGRHFTLVTDHKPLTALFSPKTEVPALAAGRLQRWASLLSSHDYTVEFRSTKAHANVDGLSRLPLLKQEDGESSDVSVFNVSQISTVSVSVVDLCKATRSDPVLSKVYYYLQRGWPRQCPELLKPFWSHRNELSIEEGCILWGVRVLVPKKLQPAVLQMLHEGHVGMVKVKQIACSYVWWPHIDKDIEELIKGCKSCQQDQKPPVAAPLHPWLWPSKPWIRVHLDFAGPFMGKTFLIAVDAFSKWPPEIIEMSTTTAANTIRVLRELFAVHGIPEQLVSDNGPQFVSTEFLEFCKSNGVKHLRVAPYHPASNGLAERMVQTFKQAMRRSRNDGIPFQHRLANFLLKYRTTPHTTTNIAPCELLMGRVLRTRLDMLRPNLEMKVYTELAKQKQRHDEHSKERNFKAGDTVWARDFRGSTKWVSGMIIQSVGPVSYMIQLQDGQVWKRHVDHVRQRVDNQDISTRLPDVQPTVESPWVTYPEQPPLPCNSEPPQTEQSQFTTTPQNTPNSHESPTPGPQRNPPRNRKPPRRFQT